MHYCNLLPSRKLLNFKNTQLFWDTHFDCVPKKFVYFMNCGYKSKSVFVSRSSLLLCRFNYVARNIQKGRETIAFSSSLPFSQIHAISESNSMNGQLLWMQCACGTKISSSNWIDLVQGICVTKLEIFAVNLGKQATKWMESTVKIAGCLLSTISNSCSLDLNYIGVCLSF